MLALDLTAASARLINELAGKDVTSAGEPLGNRPRHADAQAASNWGNLPGTVASVAGQGILASRA